MATKNPHGNPSLAESGDGPAVPSQAQSVAETTETKKKADPNKADETQFFDTTIAKVKVIDGEDVVVMSDFLDPGEELKTVYDERKAKERDDKAKEDADKDAK